MYSINIAFCLLISGRELLTLTCIIKISNDIGKHALHFKMLFRDTSKRYN